MIIVPLPPTNGKFDWTSEDAVLLRNFLGSPTGNRLLNVLALTAPDLLDGSHPNKTLVASGRLSGFQEAVTTIVRLMHEDPNSPPKNSDSSPNYASLDDDKAWETIDKENELGVDKPDQPATS